MATPPILLPWEPFSERKNACKNKGNGTGTGVVTIGNLERGRKGGFVKGWFWRMCLVPAFVPGEHANVPSFWRMCLVPAFVPGEHANVPSIWFSLCGNIRMYPRSGFRSGGTSTKTALLENHPFVTPRAMPFFTNSVGGPQTTYLRSLLDSFGNCLFCWLQT